MLSGQLTPSTANFVPRPQQYFIEDEVTTIEIPYKSEKNITTSSTNISTTTTTSLATSSTTISTATAATAGTTTTTTTISIPSVFNITNGGETSAYNATAATATATATASAIAANDASGRSAALERAYVHDVYENCEEPSGPIRPRVAQFLAGLEPGSIVCDVGCGNGRYLTSCNPLICTIGVDRCYRLTKVAKEKGGEVALCDNLELPFRDESFDAVLSLAVVHHFATTERRVGAIRELARILRIGGRVVISVWALEQRHRRFESQDVLIPWQPPKNRNYNYSDEEDDDDYLPPYHAYTEDSTNSSRSAGDGDSSSLSSSSPGESCYSFVRRAIQKLAGGRKHPWFLDSWNSKETKNDSSLEYEDAKDLPIELRRLEDFEDFPDPPLSAGLKSRSLGSILNPPPRQIVRSRSSVPSLGAQMPEQKPSSSLPSATTTAATVQQSPQKSYAISSGSSTSAGQGNSSVSQASSATVALQQDSSISVTTSATMSPTAQATTVSSGRRPKLVKQKQSLCDDEYQLPDNPFHTIGNSNSSSNSNSCCNTKNITNINAKSHESKLFLRKQSSLNEELMAESRLREKERVRKRIQKQMSLNEAFLCRSLFSKRLQIIREGFTTKLKTSTGSLERVTKNGFVKIMQNFKASQFSAAQNNSTTSKDHTNDSSQQNSNIVNNQSKSSTCTVGGSTGNHCNNSCNNNNCNNVNNGNEDQKPRRHSRESGSDSSKDSSLQSDTSIESEDSFASVIYIPRPEQQGNHQQPQNSNNNNNNNNSSNSICNNGSNIINSKNNNSHKIPSVPTSPLIMPCPPTPAHSPAAITAVSNNTTTITQTSMLSPPRMFSNTSHTLQGNNRALITNRFTFDEEHINQQQEQQQQNMHQQQVKKNSTTTDAIIGGNTHRQSQQHKSPKITRQTIKDLPPIPKFRKQQSLQQASKASFPIVRRASAAPAVPKLMSLELFNPETDDLDSDSSEPSSPDSIDSVISALKPGTDEELSQQQQNRKEIADLIGSLKTSPQPQTTNNELPSNGDHFSLDMSKASKLQKHRDNQQQYSFDIKTVKNSHDLNSGEKRSASVGETKSTTELYGMNAAVSTEQNYGDTNTGEYLLLNKTEELQNFNSDNLFYNSNNTCRQDLVEFAEQLSAQLLKELEEKNKLEKNAERVDSIDEDDNIRNSFNSAIDDPFVKKRNGECRDLTSLREELRERRLLLANLTTHHSQQQSPTLTSSSTSSLSSQTRSFTIHEEDDEVDDVDTSIFDSKKFKTKYLRTFNNTDYRQPYNVVPDTAYLIQEDGDSSVKDDEDDEIEHDVIIEEDEDQDEENEYNVCEMNEYGKRTSSNTITCMEDPSSPKGQIQLETRPSTESWGHSNSTTSLDSPSQGGGSTTHHRYYHVFREGELDALINHHVASLHIVSSYYERASWCVVAEKVQVWTI